MVINRLSTRIGSRDDRYMEINDEVKIRLPGLHYIWTREVLRTTFGGRNGWFYDEILKYGRVHVHVCKKK